MEPTRRAPAWATAVNLLTGELFRHHPVMLQLDLGPFPVERGVLVEWNDLRVPAHYDCDIFNNGTAWGNYFYFSEQASRWTMCWYHYAELRSGLRANMVPLPVVDEEYHEMVATYQSVLRARAGQPYVYLDLGARWGTWGARAVRFLQARRPKLQYRLHLVETFPESCEAIGEVMRKNGIAYTLQCGYATPSSFEEWAASVDHVDMIDMDIQGAELPLLQGAMRTLKQKAYRLTIATHAHKHDEIRQLLLSAGWLLVSETPHQKRELADCVERHFRGRGVGGHAASGASPPLRRGGLLGRGGWRAMASQASHRTHFDWPTVLREGCFANTSRGPVCQADGELVVDNPRFVARERLLSMDDTFVRTDDLRHGKELHAGG